ncbi:DUF2710 family protein [Mycobacterium koreense]|uniref:Uncharacterized protein n=1 Tax=Mycolicibacillus koreensis TaxID=1069220 RepID=A0A7I7SHP2_9MYCO|nr:DUF2710 family protein [Mycolicibacillus koreensis]MCV7247099.1 DUF2710 family protein [Mycolicibacillus koreensis]ODR09881.1 hypothetical protein BHQ15_06290 [Mycolicibacillus koreensis]OSC31878.1 hypothetical protein B8W67_15440 [Mycolicibacillus koreensis]BBY55951.1 hypothetical protein MKOR_32020 [Mycolicibacillus koreensis]
MPRPARRTQLDDTDLVESVLRDLRDAAHRWEALVAEAQTTTYSVDLGDIQAVVNADGRLIDLTLHPAVTTTYTHTELADRLNVAFDALRREAQADNRARYGGPLR